MGVLNPVIPGYNPDPSIVRVGDRFYVVTSTNEHAPGIPVYESSDLVTWEQIGNVLVDRDDVPLGDARSSLGVFAPTIRHHEGTFIVIATLVGRGHFVVTAEHPGGPWSTPTFLDGAGWDPSLTFDGGRAILTWSTGREIMAREIEPWTWRALGPDVELWRGTGGDAPESPHLYLVDERWYLLIAEGGTGLGHAITIARGADPLGSFDAHPSNPLLTHRGLSHPFQCVGHADLVQAGDGAWWAVMLATRRAGGAGYQLLGRETFLCPVTWSGGWPVFGVDGVLPLDTGIEGPGSERVHVDGLFGASSVEGRDPGWLAIRDPQTPWLRSSPAGFVFQGTSETLDGTGSPAFLGRRQAEFGWRTDVTVDARPTLTEAAGLAVRRDERHHYEIVVVERDGRRAVEVRARIGDLASALAVIDLAPGPVRLRVESAVNTLVDPVGSPGTYRFYADDGGGMSLLADIDARYLSTEVAGGFGGVVIGMYATGGGDVAGTPAIFRDWWSGPHNNDEPLPISDLVVAGGEPERLA